MMQLIWIPLLLFPSFANVHADDDVVIGTLRTTWPAESSISTGDPIVSWWGQLVPEPIIVDGKELPRPTIRIERNPAPPPTDLQFVQRQTTDLDRYVATPILESLKSLKTAVEQMDATGARTALTAAKANLAELQGFRQYYNYFLGSHPDHIPASEEVKQHCRKALSDIDKITKAVEQAENVPSSIDERVRIRDQRNEGAQCLVTYSQNTAQYFAARATLQITDMLLQPEAFSGQTPDEVRKRLNIRNKARQDLALADAELTRQVKPLKTLDRSIVRLPAPDFLNAVAKMDPSSDLAKNFKLQAEMLKNAAPNVLPGRLGVWDSSVQALKVAFDNAYNMAGEAASHFFRISQALLNYATSAKGFADLGTAFTPVVSEARAFYELVSGKDLISGESLSLGSKAILGVGFMLGVGTGPRELITGLERALGKEVLKGAENSLRAAESAAETAKNLHLKTVMQEALRGLQKTAPEVVEQIVSERPSALGELGRVSIEVNDAKSGLRKMVQDWLGHDYPDPIIKKGNYTFMSKDGTKKFRVDFYDRYGDQPHVHFQELKNGDWVDVTDTHRYYPTNSGKN